MTTEIDAEGLAKAHEAFLCSKSNAGVQGYLEDAIRAYLSASRRTSEAEPVAWRYRYKTDRTGDEWDDWLTSPTDPRDWVWAPAWHAFECEPIFASPLPTPARDDQVEAVTDDMVEAALKAWFADEINYLEDGSEADMAGWKRDMRAALLAAMGSTKL